MHPNDSSQPATTTRDLRIFGLVFGTAFGLMMGLGIPLLRHRQLLPWPWAVTAAVWLLAVAVPESLRGFHVLWTGFGRKVGLIQTRIMLGIVFFLVVTPLGWLMRLFRRRASFDPAARTYRVPSVARSPQSMERPF
jgi:cation transporter-like permease